MRFVVERDIFERLPNACFGVVMARGIDNTRDYPEIDRLLDASVQAAARRFEGTKVKEDPDVTPYREAFRALGINPNKYHCSVEALFTRIAKGKGMPRVNPVVDLGNAVSLAHTLPLGAHDLGGTSEDVCIRLTRPGDTFLPFGGSEEEAPDEGEAVYAVGSQVRTRRWTWRQSEHGKITAATTDVFFPIDGFADVNLERVLAARDELRSRAEQVWGCETTVGLVDASHPAMEL